MKNEVNAWLAATPHQQAYACARVAEVEHARGLAQGPDAAAVDAPKAVPALLDDRTQGAQRVRRARHVVALEQALDAGLAGREGTEDEGAVRD